MARVQLIIPDVDRDRFAHQARLEGKSLSAWLRAAARERLQKSERAKLFESPEDVREFFRHCDTLEGPDAEPDWSQHLRVISQSRERGASGT